MLAAASPSIIHGSWHRSYCSARLLHVQRGQQHSVQTRGWQAPIECRAGLGGASFDQDSSGRVGNASFSAPGAGGGAAGVGGGGKPPSKLGRLQQQLKALGLAGVVAYGLFNTIYYTCAFLIIWFYVAKVPPGQGAAAAAKSFVQVFALTWAGSQVSKLPRAAGALLLAPIVDRGLSIIEAKLKLHSRQQAFLVVVGCCLAFAAVLFCGVVVAWA